MAAISTSVNVIVAELNKLQESCDKVMVTDSTKDMKSPAIHKNFPDMHDWSKLPEAAGPANHSSRRCGKSGLHTAARVKKTFERRQHSKLQEAPQKSQPRYEDDFGIYSNLNLIRKTADVAMCQLVHGLDTKFIKYKHKYIFRLNAKSSHFIETKCV